MTALLAFVSALTLSYVFTRLLLRRPPARVFVDVPNERSSHDRPKPRFGGIAIVATFFAVFGVLCIVRPEFREFLPLAAGAGVLFATGLVDDWRGLGVGPRLVAQGIAATCAIGSGVVVDQVVLPMADPVHLGWLSVPLTAFLIVASINFYNFIDGIDGLAAGAAFIASTFLAAAAYMVGQPVYAAVMLIGAGSALGFLQYNFPPSKLFMGDSGSTFFGYFFAYVAIAGNRAQPEIPFLVPALLLSSLYLDAGLTIVNRVVKREKVFQPHRTHYYQRLLQIGLNHKQVTLLEYLVVILLGASALLYIRAGGWFTPFVSATWVIAFTLAILKIRGLERGDRLFWERRTMFLVTADLIAIVVAYLGAYFLRMNFQFTDPEGHAVLRALPILVVVRSACFFKYGLYRSMWRYTTTSDVVRVIKAVTAGSAVMLAVVVLLYRFMAFPRSLFVIEFFLLIALVLGTRFSTRLFHEIGREAHGGAPRRYAILGGGDAAERIAREVNAHGPDQTVACFVEDDPRRIGLRIHGVPVEGPGDSLGDICRRHRIDVLVYGVEGDDESAASLWVERTARAGIPIERAPGQSFAREPDTLVMHRAAERLDRRPVERSARAAGSLRGSKTLVTHGGGPIGGPLASMLRTAGAVPVFHLDDPALRDSSRVPRDVAFCCGPLFDQAGGIVEAAGAEVVIHVVELGSPGGLNDDDFVWNRVVRETERLARAVWKRAGSRLVIVSVWGSAASGDDAPAVAAVMEAVVLNRSGTEPTAVLRVPRVMQAHHLLEAGPDAQGIFDILESECAALAIEIAAGAFRGIYIPEPGRAFDLRTARGGKSGASVPAANAPGLCPVFPSEHVDECGLAGARRVLGPLFPASEPFRRLATSGPVDGAAPERQEWLRAISQQTRHVVGWREKAYPE